jgi:hypothetical protein
MTPAERLSVGVLTPGQRIIMAAGGLLFADSFLPWQRTCVFLTTDFPLACTQSVAWSGSGFFAGSLMAILALGLLAVTGARAAGIEASEEGLPKLIRGMVIATMAFGVIKFLYAVANHPAYGAWLGLVLMGALGYGLFRKAQEDNRIPGR